MSPPRDDLGRSLGDPQILTVLFSEPVEASSATRTANYAIDRGVSVLAANFGADSRTIILNHVPMSMRTSYMLTVSNVRDCAQTPNPIAPSSWARFGAGHDAPGDLLPPARAREDWAFHAPRSGHDFGGHVSPTNRADGLTSSTSRSTTRTLTSKISVASGSRARSISLFRPIPPSPR